MALDLTSNVPKQLYSPTFTADHLFGCDQHRISIEDQLRRSSQSGWPKECIIYLPAACLDVHTKELIALGFNAISASISDSLSDGKAVVTSYITVTAQ